MLNLYISKIISIGNVYLSCINHFLNTFWFVKELKEKYILSIFKTSRKSDARIQIGYWLYLKFFNIIVSEYQQSFLKINIRKYFLFNLKTF